MSKRATQSKSGRLWSKALFKGLVRYEPSGTYYACIRVHGKLIKRSLKTQVLTVAKLRLTDVERAERQAAERQSSATQGKMTFAEAARILQTRIDGDASLKPKSRGYYQQRITALFKSWPELKQRDVRTVTQTECLNWAARFAKETCSSAFNNTIGILRRAFDIAVELGTRYENPATTIKRVTVRPKDLQLPSADQFTRFVEAIATGGGGRSAKCADLVRFLAFGGFRLGEAINVTWGDCDFTNRKITVRGDADTGTKNSEVRKVPMIDDMFHLLTRFRHGRSQESNDTTVVQVQECQKAMDRGAKEVGMRRITHHDLRHLFATRCIETGVDIPTVSRWLGHKDGGALAMKVYGHLRDEHSTEMAQRVSFSPAPKPQGSSTPPVPPQEPPTP